MSVTYFEGISCYVGHSVEKTLYDCLEYGKNRKKTDNQRLVTSFGCDKDFCDVEMRVTQKQYEQRTGRIVNPLYGIDNKTGLPKEAPIMYQLTQSFVAGELAADTAHEIGVKLAKQFIGDKYQYVVCTHTDKEHFHNHIYFNAVSIDGARKYNKSKFAWRRVREMNDALCREYGLSIVVPGEERRAQFYSKCNAYSFRDVLRTDIDTYLESSKSYAEFLEKMKEKYVVDISGKYLKYLHKDNGQQRFVRSYSLGEKYTDEALKFYFEKMPPLRDCKNEKLTFVEVTKARGNHLVHRPELSHTEKMRNIKAMFFTIGVLNKNDIEKRVDCDNRISDLSQKSREIKELLHEINQKLFISKSDGTLPQEIIIKYKEQSDQLMEQLVRCNNQMGAISLATTIASRLRSGERLLVDGNEMKFIQQERKSDYTL